VAVIAIGYRAPEQDATAASAAPLANSTTNTNDRPAVNDVVANDIAASVATASNLAIAPNVAERAVSTRVQTQYAASDVTSSISKPTMFSFRRQVATLHNILLLLVTQSTPLQLSSASQLTLLSGLITLPTTI